MNVLSTYSPDTFYQAVLHNDLTSLRTIPGIGQKTAQHLVLELKDKVTKLVGTGVLGDEGVLGWESKTISDALQAMMTLGYSAAESRRAVLTAAQSLGEKTTVEEILKSSLKSISN
jgi:Holliday junction DNA helicase RuvA